MSELFSPDLVLVENFLTEIEELYIVSNIPPTTPVHKNTRNSIRRYGSNIPYKNQMESSTIPEYLNFVSTKLIDAGLLIVRPNSVSINEYLTGNSIAPHIDSIESGDIITIVSLLSDATMVFSKEDLIHNLIIPRRSLLQLKNDIRYKWYHSILPVKSKRYSIVFRNG